MDRNKQNERERMDKRVQLERADMDRKVHMAHVEMDFKIQEERGKIDQILQEHHQQQDRMLMQERDNLDRNLKEEREEMDRIIEMERIRMDSENMQARLHMDRMLQEEIHDKDINVLLEEKPTKEHVQKGNKTHHQAISERIKNERNECRDDVVMKFMVHNVGRDYFHNPKEYLDDRISVMTFIKPSKVEWHSMLEHLDNHGMKWNSDLYYLDPLREAPDGLVKILGPQQVHELMHAHDGIKVCDLYMVNEKSTSDNNDGNDAQGDIAGLTSTERLKAFINGAERLTSDTELNMKRDRDSSSCNDISSQPKKHRHDSSDEDDYYWP